MANITNVEDAKSYKVSKTNIINFSREKTPEWLKEIIKKKLTMLKKKIHN